MTSKKKNSGGRIFVGLALVVTLAMIIFVPTQSKADVLAASTNVNQKVFTDSAKHYLPINGSKTTLTFTTTTANQRVVVLFNAECSVKSSDHYTYVDTDIMIDGVIAPPSTSDNALCTSDGSNLPANWVSASTNVVRVVPAAGVHTLKVRVSLKNFTSGEQYWIDDISVIVMK
ncbi:hypothetical protein SAMN04489760_103105 [Syntrophus gentianae]|uniref:Uncharacterized protein n=1 Tax=Syntrophus gentianae TaxID=43775 RepID=A0A1H7VA98_9BACT|nr:hypothetical protein [Syntrophus gentianae]SEM05687.1 hypothetical protein SAMN04489760_103105 [Syntrophus gentianae]